MEPFFLYDSFWFLGVIGFILLRMILYCCKLHNSLVSLLYFITFATDKTHTHIEVKYL